MCAWISSEVNKYFSTKLPDSWRARDLSIDTRTLSKDDIFVALKGLKFDGHDYVNHAFEAGASAVLVDHVVPSSFDKPQIVVQDVLEGLRQFATAARARTGARVAGITGSVGKTSTKEALNFILEQQAKTYATPRSFNNHWGLPLTIANLPEDAVYGVIEMGMNNLGEISSHTHLTKPHVAYITNIEGVHIGKLGSQAGIAKAKAEIFEGLQSDGIAIINSLSNEFAYLEQMANAKTKAVWKIGSDIRLVDCTEYVDHQVIRADICGESVSFRLNMVGSHWATNSLGILAVVKALGADIHCAADKLSEFRAVAGRGQIHSVEIASGQQILVIDESYNAGPVSMRAALEVLRKSSLNETSRRIAVLGDMLELGEAENQEHQKLKDDIILNKIDLVYTSGERMRHLAEVLPQDKRGIHLDDPKLLAKEVCANVQPGDIYMIKGSRGGYQALGRMYAVVESLLNMNQKGKQT